MAEQRQMDDNDMFSEMVQLDTEDGTINTRLARIDIDVMFFSPEAPRSVLGRGNKGMTNSRVQGQRGEAGDGEGTHTSGHTTAPRSSDYPSQVTSGVSFSIYQDQGNMTKGDEGRGETAAVLRKV